MDGQTKSKFAMRAVVVGLVALALVGLAFVLATSQRSLFAEQTYPSPAVYAEAAR
jgi:hypothetical protein